MQTHIPRQEKPEALCSGKNLHMHRHIHSVPLCVRKGMEHKVSVVVGILSPPQTALNIWGILGDMPMKI